MIEEFEIKGEWFLPLRKDKRAHGVLKYHPKENTTLELYGSIHSDSLIPELMDQEVILGLSNDGRQITLHKCYMTKFGGVKLFQNGEAGKASVFYNVVYTLIGLHVNSIDNFKFNTISCEIFNLDEWLGISGFDYQLPNTEQIATKEIQIAYKFPDSIEFPITDNAVGKFNFIANYPSLSRYQKSVSINQKVEFEISTKTDKNIYELLNYIIRFQNFLILALYQSTYALNIKLSNRTHSEPLRSSVKLYFSNSNYKDYKEPKFDIQMLFHYRKISGNFPIMIKNWYSKYDLLEPAINLVIEQFYNSKRFNENTFLNLAQSAETFHARIHNHTKLPKDEYKIMKKEILDSVSSKYHQWLNEQFNYGNNLNLHSRLTEIINKYSNKVLDKILSDKEEFVLQVKHSRNYYTHYSKEGKKKALKGAKLFYLSEKLKTLLVCSFLIEIGFDQDELTNSLESSKWTLFNHLAEW